MMRSERHQGFLSGMEIVIMFSISLSSLRNVFERLGIPLCRLINAASSILQAALIIVFTVVVVVVGTMSYGSCWLRK